MEFVVICRLCGLNEAWTTIEAAHSASVWHTFTKHTQQWMNIIGVRRPRDPQPETFGRRFEQWERQS